MFSFFKKKPKMPEASDKIWMSDAAKLTGLLEDIKTLAELTSKSYTIEDPTVLDTSFSGQTSKVCLMYYFEDTYKYWNTVIKEKNLPSIVLMSALEFGKSSRLQHELRELQQTHLCHILFAEHHPLAKVENLILEQIAASNLDTVSVCFYTSLEDPIMKFFGAERIMALMKQMGMKEDEVIEHQMISSAIQKAQQKLDKQVLNEAKAASAAEWFKYNIRS